MGDFLRGLREMLNSLESDTNSQRRWLQYLDTRTGHDWDRNIWDRRQGRHRTRMEETRVTRKGEPSTRNYTFNNTSIDQGASIDSDLPTVFIYGQFCAEISTLVLKKNPKICEYLFNSPTVADIVTTYISCQEREMWS